MALVLIGRAIGWVVLVASAVVLVRALLARRAYLRELAVRGPRHVARVDHDPAIRRAGVGFVLSVVLFILTIAMQLTT